MTVFCSFEFSPCNEEGKWRKDLEGFYCDPHAKAVRSLYENPPLAFVEILGRDTFESSLFGNDTGEENFNLTVEQIDQEFPDAVKVWLRGFIITELVWLPPDHPYLILLGGQNEHC